MSVNTVESFLHKLGNDRDMIASFRHDPDEALARFPLSEAERGSILEWDLHAMIDMGVSPMVLMFAYAATHGGPEKARSRYVEILSSPRSAAPAGEA